MIALFFIPSTSPQPRPCPHFVSGTRFSSEEHVWSHIYVKAGGSDDTLLGNPPCSCRWILDRHYGSEKAKGISKPIVNRQGRTTFSMEKNSPSLYTIHRISLAKRDNLSIFPTHRIFINPLNLAFEGQVGPLLGSLRPRSPQFASPSESSLVHIKPL